MLKQEGVHGLFVGSIEEAWSAAADLSAQVHIRWIEKPFEKVLPMLPRMYDEILTGAKGMYKLEPVVADGGEFIIYAPPINKFREVHGKVISQIGYHLRDYFVNQWVQFKDLPWGVLAHSTHLCGIGTFDSSTGIESPRIRVTLATGIPEEECLSVNLGYRDPMSIRIEEWQGREAEGILVVPHAGEILYRLKDS